MKCLIWLSHLLVLCVAFATMTILLSPTAQAAIPCPVEPARQVSMVRENGGRVDWSRSTGLVAFDKEGTDGFYDVYVMDPSGADERCLTCDKTKAVPQKHNGNPTWHPSGKYIVFQAQKAQHPGWSTQSSPGLGIYNDLWLTDSNGTTFVKLLDLSSAQTTASLHPHFSADGKQLAWSEMLEPADVSIQGKSAGYWALKIADFVDDGTTPRLANIRTVTPSGTAFYENHGFSPDGTQLLFSSNRDEQSSYMLINHIYVLDLASGSVKRLTFAGYNEHAQWSPDGKWIAWMSTNGNWGGTDYWLLNLSSQKAARLTYFNWPDCPESSGSRITAADFSWSADGRSLLAYLQSNLLRQQGQLVRIDLPDLDTIRTTEVLETGTVIFLPSLSS